MKYKTARQWYSSSEHFRTEKSWEEYKAGQKKKKVIKKPVVRKHPAINTPKFKWKHSFAI